VAFPSRPVADDETAKMLSFIYQPKNRHIVSKIVYAKVCSLLFFPGGRISPDLDYLSVCALTQHEEQSNAINVPGDYSF
jgi:hypothetical protein